jgi:hypothetical protein
LITGSFGRSTQIGNQIPFVIRSNQPSSQLTISRNTTTNRQIWNLLPFNNGTSFDISSGIDLHITGIRTITKTFTYWQQPPIRELPVIFDSQPPYITQDILTYPVENTDDYPQFGRSIAIYRNRMVIGAPMDDRYDVNETNPQINRGAAFSFYRDENTQTWQWIGQRLNIPNIALARSGDMFGANIVMNVSCIAIAAPHTQTGGDLSILRPGQRYNVGTVYLYDICGATSIDDPDATWQFRQQLNPILPTSPNTQFGATALAMSQSLLAIGTADCSSFTTVSGLTIPPQTGLIYIYGRDPSITNWS